MAFCGQFSLNSPSISGRRLHTDIAGVRNNNTHTRPCVSFARPPVLSHVSLSSSTSLFEDEISLLNAKKTQKVEQVRRILPTIHDPLESLMMVDSLQCLSIDHHFMQEIQEILSRQFNNLGGNAYKNLFDVALSFRLLRQHGYYVSPDIFADWRDEKGFKGELSQDIRGMLGLHEASFVGIEGEEVLDEARNFTSKYLHSRMDSAADDPCLARLIRHSLEQPFHMSLPRFNTKAHLKNQQGAKGHQVLLRELAILDFHEVQLLHQTELREVSKWWRELGLAQELTFARDQVQKWYMWPLAILSNPQFSKYRVELTKPISFIYVIDDIFDVQGTLHELILFTETIERWEVSAIHRLPRYMQMCFLALYNITNEISYMVLKEHGWNPLQSFRKAWADLCNAFLVEAKWFASGETPKAENYLKNGIISSGVNVLLVYAFFLLGHGITKQTVETVDSIPGLISSPASILRLWDDLGNAKDESQDGNDGSYVELYMKENGITSPLVARDHVMRRISEEWKVLNKECLCSTLFSPSFKEACLNTARMVQIMYNYDQNQRLPALEGSITSLLHEKVIM